MDITVVTAQCQRIFHPEVYLLNQYECLELVGERSSIDTDVGMLRKKDPTHYHDNARTLLTKLRKRRNLEQYVKVKRILRNPKLEIEE